jgi:tRNA threonylcarbamoyladenosine biosynthesis protein TsaB
VNQLLAIETSSEVCSVALSVNGETRVRHQHAPLRHAELLLPSIRSLLEEAGIGLSELDGIAFGRGPGSFTSLRIGIGVVQGLAWGADLPVIPLSSLASVACQVSDPAARIILVAMDARMSEVFHGSFQLDSNGVLKTRSSERVEAPEKVRFEAPENTIGVGNGFERYVELEQAAGSLYAMQAELLPSATALLGLAGQWLLENEPLPASEAQPVYVRNQVAIKPG